MKIDCPAVQLEDVILQKLLSMSTDPHTVMVSVGLPVRVHARNNQKSAGRELGTLVWHTTEITSHTMKLSAALHAQTWQHSAKATAAAANICARHCYNHFT